MALTLAWLRMLSFRDCRRAWVLISELLVRQLLSSFPDLDLAVAGRRALRLSSAITSAKREAMGYTKVAHYPEGKQG
jgi:hypothetical protein